MDKEAVQSFIQSHRAKLEQEKENLGMAAVQSRGGGGILPEDWAAEHRRDKLRRERQEEYRAFLKQQNSNKPRRGTTTDSSHHKATPFPRPPSALADKRRALAQDRQQELRSNLSHGRPPLPPSQYQPPPLDDFDRGRDRGDRRNMWPDRDRHHNAMNAHHGFSRDDRFAEAPSAGYDGKTEQPVKDERWHRGGNGYHSRDPPERERWGEGGSGGQRQVHFDDHGRGEERANVRRETQRRHWDEEEEGLLHWARGQGRSNGPEQKSSRPPTSPTLSPCRKEDRAGGSRSLSAPVVGGIAALGAGSGERERRQKQREYAEQLRAQMREKQAEKEREKEGIVSDATTSYPGSERRQPPDPMDAGKPRSSWQPGYHNMKERNTKPFPPQRRERVHFSPERNAHVEPDYSSSKPAGDQAQFQPYWPGMYYGGYPYPPPANFPPFPPPQNGLPYYPPPPPMPPSLSNPYFPPYYPPHHPPDATHTARETTQGRSSRGAPSPYKITLEKGDEELNFMLGESGKSAAKSSKEAYRAQLVEQIRERHENKQRQRLEKSEFEKKKELEVYDPFGKGGCGAPIRDRRGQLVTDLNRMKKVNDERMMIGLPSTTPLPGELAEGGAAGILDNSFTEHTSPRSSYEFRRSKELRSKSVQGDYKEILEQQMREREEIKRREKEKSNEADKLEQERIERERRMLEEKYKMEKGREKELKMRNEALQREQEEREREEAERKREEEWRQKQALRLDAEKKKQTFIDNMEKQLPPPSQVRSDSPPIPTLRKLDPHSSAQAPTPSHPQPTQRQSPPVPTLRHKQQMASNNRGEEGYPTVNSQQSSRHQPQLLPSGPPSPPPPLRTNTATIRQPDSEQLDRLQQSFSAHAAVPQPASGDVSVGVASRNTEHLPPQHNVPVPQSVSAPHPSSSGVSVPHPPKQATSETREDYVMENLLQNLHSMRRRLETERQKVTAHNEPWPSTGGGDTNAARPVEPLSAGAGKENGKPGFWKAKLAGSRRSRPAPSDPRIPVSGFTAEQQTQDHLGERGGARRKQWQLVPMEELRLQPSRTSSDHLNDFKQRMEHYRGSEAAEVYHAHRGEGGTHALPPTWLRPRPPRGHDSASMYSDLTQMRSPSVGGESQFSVATLDVEGMARRNEERMKRLESILNSQARDSRTPQTILSDFLARHSRAGDGKHTSSESGGAPSLKRPAVAAGSVFASLDDHQSRGSGTSQELDCETGYPVAASTPT